MDTFGPGHNPTSQGTSLSLWQKEKASVQKGQNIRPEAHKLVNNSTRTEIPQLRRIYPLQAASQRRGWKHRKITQAT